jgi:coenzyme F420-reducing hydrogenase beta subunit
LGAFVGHSRAGDERERGSSGGLATRVLKALLEKQMVSGVVTVVPTTDPTRLFEPAVLHTAAEVDEAVGSKYYPVEFSEVLQQLRDAGGRYAIVGLPCALRAIALARDRHPWVAERVPYLLGLVCGRGTSKRYTGVLGHIAGLGLKPLCDVKYRSKESTTHASQFTFVARAADGTAGTPIRFTDGWANRLWGRKLLVPDACFACTDLFAVSADMTFMDAWLPEYASDPRGTSIVVVRDPGLARLLEEERQAGHVQLTPVTEADVLRSQGAPLQARRQIADGLGLGPGAGRWGTAKARAKTHWDRGRSRLSKWLLRGRGARQTAGLWLLMAYLRLLRIGGALRSRIRGEL